MKFNWKVLVAFVVLLGVSFWGIDSLRTRAYSGTNLNFDVGSGPVTMMNPSDAALPVQLTGTGTRSFSVTSATQGVSGSSTRQGSGRNTTQLFEFDLPPGVSEFTVTRGSEVMFAGSADTPLEATVQPLNAANSQTTLIVTVIVILGALFYLSRATEHRWISRLRRADASVQDTQPTPTVVTDDPNKGRDGRMYQDV